MAQVTPSGTVRTFRIASLFQMMRPAIFTCVIVVVILYIVMPPDEHQSIWPLVVLLALAMALVAWLSTRARLMISAEEIVYYAIGYRVRASWENVAGCGERVMGANSVECLILRQSGIELDRWLAFGYKALPFGQIAAMATGQPVPFSPLNRHQDVIPVSLFAENWRDSEIGDLVRRYAPQAFDNPAT